MYPQALTGYEKTLGPDHTSTLSTVTNLSLLYSDQGKMERWSRCISDHWQALRKCQGLKARS